jgi:hypothetical protein
VKGTSYHFKAPLTTSRRRKWRVPIADEAERRLTGCSGRGGELRHAATRSKKLVTSYSTDTASSAPRRGVVKSKIHYRAFGDCYSHNNLFDGQRAKRLTQASAPKELQLYQTRKPYLPMPPNGQRRPRIRATALHLSSPPMEREARPYQNIRTTQAHDLSLITNHARASSRSCPSVARSSTDANWRKWTGRCSSW